jgi:nanoRNase/pAp phosphatase (c-di-AMP/oligoRNAs hydrolase)
MTWKPDIVIYHSPCDDGFGAAWAAWKRWGDSVEYVPATYGKPAPDVAGKHVLMADFSYKRLELEAMAQSAKSIIILDHHKTARDELAPFQYGASNSRGAMSIDDVPAVMIATAEFQKPAVAAVFDMDRSGARMTWDFCHPDKDVPELIRLIEDRDLCRFDYPQTRAFSLWLRSHRYDFQTWDRIAQQMDSAAAADIMRQAIAIEGFYDQKISEIAATARWLKINNIPVPVANCTWAFASDVAHALLVKHPEAAFAATYYDRGDGARTYSLRSEDERDDVSVHARRYGGGGHRNAAGFEVPAI